MQHGQDGVGKLVRTGAKVGKDAVWMVECEGRRLYRRRFRGANTRRSIVIALAQSSNLPIAPVKWGRAAGRMGKRRRPGRGQKWKSKAQKKKREMLKAMLCTGDVWSGGEGGYIIANL